MIRPLDLGGLNHRRQVGSTCPAKERFGRDAPESGRVMLTLSFVVPQRRYRLAGQLGREGAAYGRADKRAMAADDAVLAWDNDFVVISSQNWLSADPSESNPRGEMGVFLHAPGAGRRVIERFQFECNAS